MDQPRDTIASIATGADVAGIGIVRLSGPRAHEIGRALVGRETAPPVRTAVLSRARDADGAAIDQGLYLEFAEPRSMTGEAVAEFQGHGSRVGLSRVLRRCLELGARAAEPGEFSRRAFEAGRLDLAQAEAIAAGIGAATDAAHRMAVRQANGELSRQVRAIRAPLLRAASSLNADVEFPDEDLGELDREDVLVGLSQAESEVARLLGGYRAGRLLAEGARVALIGPPNAGKSSLLNALLGHERAIVSPVAGTTRDTVEERISLFGLAVRLVDTAGLRGADEATDPVEALGIARARRAMAEADVIVAVVADDCDWVGFVRGEMARQEREDLPAARTLWVWNKADRTDSPRALLDLVGEALPVSAYTGSGLEDLRAQVRARLGAEASEGDLVFVERHARLLEEARAALVAARTALEAGVSSELALVDVGISIHRLSAIVGENLEAAVYADIFRRFCIGK